MVQPDAGGPDLTASSNLRWAKAAAPEPLGRRDLVAMAAGFTLCLLVSLVLGHNRLLWEDEMLGWMLLHDSSWHHMVQAWKMGADGGGFAFYLLGRGWFDLFGASPTAFRLFSASCFGAAFCTMWATARRFYGFWITAIALFTSFFASPPVISHATEGRFYGLLVFSTAAVVAVTVRVTTADRDKDASPSARSRALDCVLLFLVHGLLTTSHLLGVVYSVALLGALVVLDRLAGRMRPLLYGSAAAAWLLLWPERQAIMQSAAVGRPHFWTVPARLSSFIGAYTNFSYLILLMLLMGAGALGASWLRSANNTQHTLRLAMRERRPVLVSMFALFCVPVVLAVESHVATSVFINRYLIPLTVADALLLLELLWQLQRAYPAVERSPRLRTAMAGAWLVAMLLWGVQERKAVTQRIDYTPQLLANMPAGLPPHVPVVAEDAWIFTELMGSPLHAKLNFVFLLDWPWAISNEAPRLEVTQYHLMENWRKVGYFSNSILDRDSFLRDHPVFLVLRPEARGTEPDGSITIGNFLVDRFRTDPAYQVRRLSTGTPDRPGVWEVCRGTCPA